MSELADIEAAIRRWWLHDRPAVERMLFKAYRVASLPDAALRMMHRGVREAFIAGWHARGRLGVAAGEQGSLFDSQKVGDS